MKTHLRPKRYIWCRLGPFSSSQTSLSLYFINYIQNISQNIYKNRIKLKKTHLWPKRCQICRLGPFSLTLPNLSRISLLKPKDTVKTQLVLKKSKKKRKKSSPRAQKMHMTSFGPVSVVPAQSDVHLVIRTCRYIKILVSIKKNEENERKYSLGAQTTCLFIVPAQSNLNFIIGSYIYNQTLVTFKNNKEKINK